MRHIVFPLAIAFAISGCASVPQETAAESAGPEPTQAEIETFMAAHFRDTLKDADSVKDFSYRGKPEFTAWGGGAGWLVCYRMNAKNSYGGYTGIQNDGVILRMYSDRFLTDVREAKGIARQRC